MTRLSPCPSCRSHVLSVDERCPHCGASLRTSFAPRASAILLGLALAGCPGDDSTGDEGADGPSTSAPGTTTQAASEGTEEGSGTTAAPTSGTATLGEPEYGVPGTSTG